MLDTSKIVRHSDAVIGHVTKYTFDHIKPWVKSLNDSGFDGDKILCVYDMDIQEAEKVKEYGCSVCYFNVDTEKGKFYYLDNVNYNVVVERFSAMVDILSIRNYDYIVTTDVKDVMFQSNPIDWVKNNILS